MKHFAIAAFALVLCAAISGVNAEENKETTPAGYEQRIVNLPSDMAEFNAEYPGEKLVFPMIENNGGNVNTFITNRLIMEHYGVGVQLIGHCYSACVIYSGMKDACVENDTWFLFHQGTDEWTTLELFRLMNPHFKKFLSEYAVPLPPLDWSNKREKYGQAYIALSGREVIEKGWMPKCL